MLYFSFLRTAGARASTLIVCIAEKEGVADVVVGGGRRRSSSLRSLIEIINSMAVPDQVVERDKTIFLHDVAFLEMLYTHSHTRHNLSRYEAYYNNSGRGSPRIQAPKSRTITAYSRSGTRSSTLLGVHTSWWFAINVASYHRSGL